MQTRLHHGQNWLQLQCQRLAAEARSLSRHLWRNGRTHGHDVAYHLGIDLPAAVDQETGQQLQAGFLAVTRQRVYGRGRQRGGAALARGHWLEPRQLHVPQVLLPLV